MKYHLFIPFLSFVLLSFTSLVAADAWDAIKTYQYGDDFKPLLVVEAEVQRSVAAPEAKAQAAARLAALLDDGTTPAGRQFVCMQLRLVGGAAEVPKLAEWLKSPDDAENVRLALTDIRCDESLAPLRKALEAFKGRELIGIVGSLAARHDRASIPALGRLLGDQDKEVAATAASALGYFGAEGIEQLRRNMDRVPKVVVGTALIQAASELVDQGKINDASTIYDLLATADMPKGVRRAALEGMLRLLTPERRIQTISAWLFDADTEKGLIAASHLAELSAEQTDALFKDSEKLNAAGRTAIVEMVSERSETTPLDELLQALKSQSTMERLAALRAIGKRNDPTTIPLLLEALTGDDLTKETARDALIRFPKEVIGPKLVEALQNDALRIAAIDTIVALKYYEAIDPMISLAKSEDESVFVPVIEGLAKLCDPDEHDLPRLVRLYLASRPDVHRERVERAVVVVCEKIPDATVRADHLIAILEKQEGGLSEQLLIRVLPLLGKVGNRRVREMIQPLMDSKDAALQQAAIRALCNWPNAEPLEDLWKMATTHSSKQYQQWALRAFIRVATLRSDRPEGETLALLRKAMNIAKADADRQWCLSRAATIRTMETVDWAASFLNDAVLSPTACNVLVELAHHRFLREPNKAHFEPILLKVEQTAQDKDIAERAKKSRLGM